MQLKKILPITGIIILIFILTTLDFEEIFTIFSGINPWHSFICFFAIVPLILIANIEWQILLRKQKIHVSFWYSIKNFFIGYFYGFITPGGIGAYTRGIRPLWWSIIPSSMPRKTDGNSVGLFISFANIFANELLTTINDKVVLKSTTWS